MMKSEKKFRFSLSLGIRIFLVVFVLLSVGVFATSVMKYNRLQEEKRELEKKLDQYNELMADLEREAGSAEKLREVLTEYKTYKTLKEESLTDPTARDTCEAILQRIDLLLSDPDTSEYLIQKARENGLAFPDEIIYYTDSTR